MSLAPVANLPPVHLHLRISPRKSKKSRDTVPLMYIYFESSPSRFFAHLYSKLAAFSISTLLSECFARRITERRLSGTPIFNTLCLSDLLSSLLSSCFLQQLFHPAQLIYFRRSSHSRILQYTPLISTKWEVKVKEERRVLLWLLNNFSTYLS